MPASLRHLTDKKLNLTSLLARWKDGLYYTAAVVNCDKTKKKCLVCFEDGSEIWLNNRDVHLQLSLDQLNEDEDIVCCVCDDGSSETPNEIILCDVCNQGYHQKCHNPPVDSSKIDESEEATDHKDWFCATCSYILNQSNREKLNASAIQQQQSRHPPQKQQQQRPQTSQASSPQKSQPKAANQSNQQVQSRQQAIPPKQADSRQPQKEAPTQQTSTPVKRPPTGKEQSIIQPASSPGPQKQSQQQQQQVTKDPQQQKTQSPQQSAQGSQTKSVSSNGPSIMPTKSPVKVKQTPTIAEQAAKQQRVATTIGAVKTVPEAQQQRHAPYPAANRVRVGPTPSAASLASMTASSALVVGGSSGGRTKQDLVNQSNSRQTVQRQRAQISVDQSTAGAITASVNNQVSPVKHAVRKSGVNFNPASPVRQSALPTATRSVLPVSPSQGTAATNPTAVIVTTPSSSIVAPRPTQNVTGSSMFGSRLAPPTPQYLLNPNSLTPLYTSLGANPQLIVPRVNNEPPQQPTVSTIGVQQGQNNTNQTSKVIVAESLLSTGTIRQQPASSNVNNGNNNNSDDNIGQNNSNRSGAAPTAPSS